MKIWHRVSLLSSMKLMELYQTGRAKIYHVQLFFVTTLKPFFTLNTLTHEK